ncbi:hypothetical protein ACSNOI_14235 [Actinomadura kijaniata]|uniref:hypothetical protein n=1 Tax=Actinomadura kijaniata TaxID=46161 RepID=UPI003F1B4C55
MTTGAVTLTAGCGDSGNGGGNTSPSSTVTPPAQRLPATGAPVRANGTVLTLPTGWRQLDPTTETSEVVRTSFGLEGATGELVRTSIAEQRKQGIVFAIDTSARSGYAPNLSTGCDRGGITGSSLEQLKRKQTVMHPGARITDLKVDGRPGFRADYGSRQRARAVAGVTVRVPVPGDRFCFVQIEAEQGSMPPQAEQIISSFRLA